MVLKGGNSLKEEWRNNGNNESQSKVECSEGSHEYTEDLKNINRNQTTDMEYGIQYRDCMYLCINIKQVRRKKPRRPSRDKAEYCSVDALYERLSRFQNTQFLETEDIGLSKILYIQNSMAFQIIDSMSRIYGSPGEMVGQEEKQDVLRNKNTALKVAKADHKQLLKAIFKKECRDETDADTIGELPASDISAVEDSVTAIVDGLESATSLQLAMREVSRYSLPPHKQLYTLHKKKQSGTTRAKQSKKSSSHLLRCASGTSSGEDELSFFRGSNKFPTRTSHDDYHGRCLLRN